MNCRIVSLNLMSTLLLFALLFALVMVASAQTRTVGVNVGDTFTYSFNVNWSSNDPTATPPQNLVSENNTQLIQVAITAISGTNITGQMTFDYKNGTQTTEGGWVDIGTGDGANLTQFITSANLAAGDSLYNSSSSPTINDTVPITYSSGVRETNQLNVTSAGGGMSMLTNFYWDKSTGILVQALIENVNQTSGFTTTSSSDIQIISSDIWTVAAVNEDWVMFHHDLQHTGYSTSTAPETNDQLWNYTTGGGIVSTPSLVNGEVYLGSEDDKIYCLNAFTGASIWNLTTGGSIVSSPAVVNGYVYVGSEDKSIYCLNASTGSSIWNYATGGSIESSPAVAEGELYIGSEDGVLYCLNASTGASIWNYTTNNSIDCSPAVAEDSVYFGSQGSNIYCLNASTGESIWNYTAGAGIFSSPAVANNNVYVGCDDKKIYCLDASTGASIWNFSAGNLIDSSPAVAYDNVYVGSEDHNVYCLDASTGQLTWNFTTGSSVFSSPAIADGKLYVGSEDRSVYCLNASTGALIWNYATGGSIDCSPAVAYGNVYIGSEDRNVYCFGLADTTPPTVTDVFQIPPAGSVSPQDTVEVYATVTDNGSGVKDVTLSYASNNGTWTNVTMSNLSGNIWSASIPAIPYGTNVTYIITAQDNAGNTITTLGTSYEQQYAVMPEFPIPAMAILLFIMSTSLAVAFVRKKQSNKHRQTKS